MSYLIKKHNKVRNFFIVNFCSSYYEIFPCIKNKKGHIMVERIEMASIIDDVTSTQLYTPCMCRKQKSQPVVPLCSMQ